MTSKELAEAIEKIETKIAERKQQVSEYEEKLDEARFKLSEREQEANARIRELVAQAAAG